jgi:predicted enzyme related to lactoylglutathione lyase
MTDEEFEVLKASILALDAELPAGQVGHVAWFYRRVSGLPLDGGIETFDLHKFWYFFQAVEELQAEGKLKKASQAVGKQGEVLGVFDTSPDALDALPDGAVDIRTYLWAPERVAGVGTIGDQVRVASE